MERISQPHNELFSKYPDILSVHQLRAALGIGRTGVYKLLEGKYIKCFKIGNTYKIPKSALIEYVTYSCNNNLKGERHE